MWGVTGVQYLDRLQKEDKVVGVFLATAFDVSAIEWLTKLWRTIHKASGYRWHLVAPTVKAINDDQRLACADNYDADLALDIARVYGLHTDRLPCVVFDNFNDEAAQLAVSFPSDEKGRRILFEDVDSFLRGVIPDPKANNIPSREELIEGLRRHLFRTSLGRSLVKLAPRIGSIGARAAWFSARSY